MDRENFIELLQKASPEEMQKFLSRNSKRKKIDPIVYIEEIPPDHSPINGDFSKAVTVTKDKIKVVKVSDSKRRKQK